VAGGHATGLLAGLHGPTADLHIRYLAAANGKWIRANATIVKSGRRLIVVDVQVRDDSGKLVAHRQPGGHPSRPGDARLTANHPDGSCRTRPGCDLAIWRDGAPVWADGLYDEEGHGRRPATRPPPRSSVTIYALGILESPREGKMAASNDE